LIERLTGVGSSKPTFYAEWRRKSRELDRAVEASRAILAALDATPRSPRALCEAVLKAMAFHFGASSASMVFSERPIFVGRLPEAISWPQREASVQPAGLPPGVRTVADRTTSRREVVLLGGRKTSGGARSATVGVPMRSVGGPVGSLVIRLREGTLDGSDLVVLEALASEIAAAIENACLYEESERLESRLTAVWAEASRQLSELEERNRQLQRARRRLDESRRHRLIGRERNRIARELHDTVAQHLVSIGMNVEWCRQQGRIPPDVRERLSVSKEVARSALLHIRSAIFELGSLDGARSGLVLALRDLAEEFRVMARLEVRVRTRGRPGPLPMAIEHSLFRIAQEAMWNVAKHAEANRAWIDLDLRNDVLRLSVSDDGSGDAQTLRRYLQGGGPRRSRRHRGLADVRERAQELHATVRCARRRGGGVRMTITVPLDGETDARR